VLVGNHPKPTRFSFRPVRFHTINGIPRAKTHLFANLDSSDLRGNY
jgi:hypothetical protein